MNGSLPLPKETITVIPNRLYFCPAREKPQVSGTKVKVLNFDSKLLYQGYNKDFGPLNLGYISIYCNDVQEQLR